MNLPDIADRYAKELADCNRHIDDGEYGKVFEIAATVLNDGVENSRFLAILGHSFVMAEKFGLALMIFEKALKIQPEIGELWTSVGHCHLVLGQNTNSEFHWQTAEKCLYKALEINPGDEHALNNLCIMKVHDCDAEKAQMFGEAALRTTPDFVDTYYNLSLSHLMRGEWKRGWRYYDLGVHGRIKVPMRYDLPVWNGELGKKVVVYGEQGLGDEIMFASMIPDMCGDVEVNLDCFGRLRSLFQRSFPYCHVRGQRFKTDRKGGDWWKPGLADCEIPIGSLGKFYRQNDQDFSGEPYLFASPELRALYKDRLSRLPQRPCIGLAWSGGRPDNYNYRRSLSLAQLGPLLSHEANFISLQYRDPPDHPKIHHWPDAVEAENYDHTAALVAELDLVISVTTSVVHLCGGLGVECWTLVPDKPQWRYQLEGDSIPWYNSVKLFRQEDGVWPIKKLSQLLSQKGIEKSSVPSTRKKITVSPASPTEGASETSSDSPEPQKS